MVVQFDESVTDNSPRPNEGNEYDEEGRRATLRNNMSRMSTIRVNIDETASIFDGEDPELVAITLRNIKNTDKNKDGRLDIDEVASAILGATKEARSAQKREKTLKRSLLGVSAFLAVFAVIFLITQGVQLSKSIEESKVTSVNEDSYGHLHLQGKNGGDLSTRGFGDKYVVENKLDLYSGRVLQCIPIYEAASMSNDVTNGVEANIVVLDTETGLPLQSNSITGEFKDTTDVLHFGNDNVRIIMDSDACNVASADPAIVPQEDSQEDTDALDRHLRKVSSSSSALVKNREFYKLAMHAIREGRTLNAGSNAVVEMPYTAAMCEVLPADSEMVKINTDSVACPALRFLIKTALQDGLFDICGYDTDDYIVDTATMKSLLTTGKGSFTPGLQRDRCMSNTDNLSVFDRAFKGAIDGQAVGVLKHDEAHCGKCIKNTGTSLVLDSTCTGTEFLWKFLASPDDSSIKIHYRSDQDYCLSLNSAEDGIELKTCTEAGDSAKFGLDGGKIKQFGGTKCIGVDASENIVVEECSSARRLQYGGGPVTSSQEWLSPPMINAADIELNFDHGASSGIIGSSTLFDSTDSDSFNQGKYDEFLGQLCDCQDPSSLDQSTTFTEADFGRAINHFGSQMVTTNTKVGPFSHAILAFEHANLYTSFKKNGVFPLTTFQALFLPDTQLVSLGLLVEADLATKFVPTVERDDIPASGHQLSGTFTAMGIQMSCATKAEMDDAVAACDCANNPSCGACGMSGMFTDLCGEGYANCMVSGCA